MSDALPRTKENCVDSDRGLHHHALGLPVRHMKGKDQMHDRLSRKLSDWKLTILEVGLFVMFLVTFGDFLIRKIWTVIGPLLR